MTLKFVSPGPVPKEAIAFFDEKNLKPGFSYRDVWREEHNVAFTVAKIMEQDILADVQDSLAVALEEGKPFRQWAKEINSTLDKSGWSAYGADRDKPRRLLTIYNTNMRSARAVGQWQRINRTKRTRPFLEYALGPSERHRDEHVAIAGTILPVDHSFWDSYMPPNGWLCKCHVIQHSRTVAERRGGQSPEPDIKFDQWTNPDTGQAQQIPRGIDPGFDYNPGKDRAKKLEELSE